MSDNKKDLKIIQLFQEMSDLTQPKCGSCRVPYSCCSKEYCCIAKEYASSEWGIELTFVDSEDKVPFLGPTGCIVPPHLRPDCTFHNCAINSIGADVRDMKWTKRYFKLREKITSNEPRLFNFATKEES